MFVCLFCLGFFFSLLGGIYISNAVRLNPLKNTFAYDKKTPKYSKSTILVFSTCVFCLTKAFYLYKFGYIIKAFASKTSRLRSKQNNINVKHWYPWLSTSHIWHHIIYISKLSIMYNTYQLRFSFVTFDNICFSRSAQYDML